MIHGGSPGADAIAGQVARELGILLRAHPADWKRFGRGAGPLRNQRMLEAEKPDLVIAFSMPASLTPGTADMVARARAADVPVEVHIAEVPDRGPSRTHSPEPNATGRPRRASRSFRRRRQSSTTPFRRHQP
ncbi:MAG: SLOG family protein [Candidatus Dormibacteraceae bacterium]